MVGQVPVGGRVGDEGQLHGEGRLGQRLGHAAVAGAHHADDRVLGQTRVTVLSRYQAPGVLQGADRLVTAVISISILYLNLTQQQDKDVTHMFGEFVGAGVVEDGLDEDVSVEEVSLVVELLQGEHEGLQALEAVVVLHGDDLVAAAALVQGEQAHQRHADTVHTLRLPLDPEMSRYLIFVLNIFMFENDQPVKLEVCIIGIMLAGLRRHSRAPHTWQNRQQRK